MKANKTMAAKSMLSMYRPQYVRMVVAMLQASDYRVWPYLRKYWTTQDFSYVPADLRETSTTTWLRWILSIGMLVQVLSGILLIVLWWRTDLVAGDLFGLALLVSYPLVWAHALVLPIIAQKLGYFLNNPKKLGRVIVCRKLEKQVVRLQQKHPGVKVVAVVGSVGKTSTKLAIAEALNQQQRVQYQQGNYNDRVTVPLIFFGQTEPALMNILAWLKVFRANERVIKGTYPYDVVVLELGTDGPGFMQEFSYLHIDVAVVTAITPEHMEYFGTLDAVAAEELVIFDIARQVIVNIDDTPAEYLTSRKYLRYSSQVSTADYFAKTLADTLESQELEIHLPKARLTTTTAYSGQPGAKFTLAAAAVADMLGSKPAEITAAVSKLQPFAGRMQLLAGLKGSKLIDDTYNASPVAVKAALDTLYGVRAKQRIAILGSMNELGAYSTKAHQEVGEYCDPKKLDLVVTIGADAEQYLAPAAANRGCSVISFASPYDAGKYVLSQLKSGAVILAKGSQNRVFAEEALKPLLADPQDASKLVRQSATWMKQKKEQFLV